MELVLSNIEASVDRMMRMNTHLRDRLERLDTCFTCLGCASRPRRGRLTRWSGALEICVSNSPVKSSFGRLWPSP